MGLGGGAVNGGKGGGTFITGESVKVCMIDDG